MEKSVKVEDLENNKLLFAVGFCKLLAGGESMEVSMLKDRNFRSIGNRQEEPINTFEDDLVFRVIAHALNGNKVRADSLEIRQEKGRCTKCGGGIDRLMVKIEFG
jgi:hypothetical protein